MKMTWLHELFGLFFIPADGKAKSAQQLILTVLPFPNLYFPWYFQSFCNTGLPSLTDPPAHNPTAIHNECLILCYLW